MPPMKFMMKSAGSGLNYPVRYFIVLHTVCVSHSDAFKRPYATCVDIPLELAMGVVYSLQPVHH